MAVRLGATFLRCAMGPVSYAGQCIMASKVADGLHELAVEALQGGLHRGIDEVARRAGLAPHEVEGVLPMGEIRVAATALGLSQPRAVEAWQRYAGHLGGLLRGIAELTVDGRVPDVGLCLERLAQRLSRDKPLAEPLLTLSADVERWQGLVTRCREALDGGDVVGRAYRRRRRRRVALIFASGTVAALALTLVAGTLAARSRVDALLASGDPCKAEAVDGSDLRKASTEQKAKASELRNVCEQGRAAEVRAREEARARAEREQEAARQVEARRAVCAALAERVGRGELTAEDEASAGVGGPLLRRIASGTLARGDLAIEPTFPCGDTPSADVLRESFAKAVLAAPTAWANAEDLSPAATRVLVEHLLELPETATQRLANHAEEAARSALLGGNPIRIEQASRLCKAVTAISIEIRPTLPCARLLGSAGDTPDAGAPSPG